jgi:NADH-quinone oxidoreductase subunit A
MSLVPLIFYIFVALTLGLLLISISEFFGKKNPKKRVNQVYESGVNPLKGATRQYDIKYYRVAVLFLLFDVEVVLLLPWVANFNKASNKEFLFYEFLAFIILLIVGYIFVVMSKSLKWDK